MRTNNRSFMESRREPDDSLDFFPTQPWATRAIAEILRITQNDRVWDPAAGEGHMHWTLCEYTERAFASDVHNYGTGDYIHDFLMMGPPPPFAKSPMDWIITNPPFTLAEEFALKCIDLHPNKGFALLMRANWRSNGGRYERLMKHAAPSCVYEFCDRLLMMRGKCARQSDRGASGGATEYAWFVWEWPLRGGIYTGKWIPRGTRARLERDDDYD